MSIVLSIIAGIFSFLFLRGLYNHIWYLYHWRKVRNAVMTNPHLSPEEKQEVIDFARDFVKREEGVDLP